MSASLKTASCAKSRSVTTFYPVANLRPSSCSMPWSGLLPGVMGKLESAAEESFSDGLLEHPHYTKPNSWEGLEIPEILLGGDHKAIASWKREQRENLTKSRRPDLWAKYHKPKG